jgi:hypothetical protein
MATPTPPKSEPVDRVFELVATREAEAMKVARTWVHSVGEAIPVELPLVRELSREILDFTEELLRIQREFARDLLAETHAVMHRVSTGGTRPAAHHAPATTKARKTAA